jgi:hypothetical protein
MKVIRNHLKKAFLLVLDDRSRFAQFVDKREIAGKKSIDDESRSPPPDVGNKWQDSVNDDIV